MIFLVILVFDFFFEAIIRYFIGTELSGSRERIGNEPILVAFLKQNFVSENIVLNIGSEKFQPVSPNLFRKAECVL